MLNVAREADFAWRLQNSTPHLTSAIVARPRCARWSQPARADLQLCNRMSYVVEAAIAHRGQGRDRDARLVPHRSRPVPHACSRATPPAETLYIHARALAVYGASPLPQAGHADFCVGNDNFVIAGARNCSRAGQQLARFTAVKPSETEQGADRLSRRGRRIYRRAGARRRHPAPAGHRRLRRHPDRRRPRHQDRRGARAVHRRQQARDHRGRPLATSSMC